MATVIIPCLACRAGTIAEEDASSVTCATCSMALPPPGESAWLMTRSGSDQYGPYTLVQLAAYIAEARILPGDGIWHHGATVRLNAGQLPPFGAAAPAPVQTAGAAPAAAQPVAQAAPAAAPAYAAPVAYAAPSGGNKAGLHIKRAFNWNLRTLPVDPDEEAQLLANGVDEADARRYLVWRRSVLLVVAIPLLAVALLATIGLIGQETQGLSAIGSALPFLSLLPLFALPLTAWLAAKTWDQHRRSRTILIRGWLFANLIPLLLALIPFTWRVDYSVMNPMQQGQLTAILSFAGAMTVYVTLMPAVLSLIPGVLRACLRIKALIPESILPGLFLVAATPLYVLLFLVIFTTVNQVAGNGVLIFGVIALVGAPMFYLINGRLFTRPLRSEEEIAKIGSVQMTVLVAMGIGLLLIVVYAFTAQIFGKSLIGTDAATSVMRPWNASLIQFPIEYMARSLLTTVLVADLFMMMNLQLWKHTREFQASPDAESYDRLMTEIEEAGYTPAQLPRQPTA